MARRAKGRRGGPALGGEDRLKQFAWSLVVLAGRGQATSRAIGRAMVAVSEGKLDWFDPEGGR